MRLIFQKIYCFFTVDLWRYSFDKAKPVRAFFLHWMRIIVSACRGFAHHQSFLRASLLTYYTLLAIVPVLAVAFGISKGFGFEHFFEKQLYERFHEQLDVVQKVVEFAHNLLDRTQEGIIVAVGVAVLFWAVLKLLGNIENALNVIWEVKKARSLARKITDYFALIIFCPFFFVFSSGAAVFVVTQLGQVASTVIFRPFGPALTFTFHLFLTFLLSWILFSFIYVVMPNTKVRLRYGILAGIVGGTIYQVVQWTYITFQIGASNYGAIYGSFAALPLFLIWVHLSWLIFLFGAEFGYSTEEESFVQFRSLDQSQPREEVSKETVAVLMTFLCVQAFCRGATSITLSYLTHRLQVPVRVIQNIMDQLVEMRVLSQVITPLGEKGYQPAIDVQQISIQKVLDAMNNAKQEIVFAAKCEDMVKVEYALHTFHCSIIDSKDNFLLKNLDSV